jgi:formylmethanofuran dehydrogenase subunit B
VARAGLAGCAVPAGSTPRVGGQPSTLDAAVRVAAAQLAAARQPLMGGLGTDVAGGRALFALARATGAIADPAAGRALAQVLRAQQDRGGYTTTLAEVRERADLIAMVGSWAPLRAPELLPRALMGRMDDPPSLLALGCEAPAAVQGVPVTAVPVRRDLFHTLAELTALVAGRAVREPDAALAELAGQLKAARYAVLVWEPAQLGPQAALLIERLQQLIGLLNAKGRAAGFPLGGGDGAATVNQVFAWLSGLPLRSRLGPLGLEHEPLRFDATTLLARGEVDALLWVSSYRAAEVPALADGGDGWRIVLGLPSLAQQLGDESRTVFIPVATPGVHTGGHLCRADGVVMLPLHAAMRTDLPLLAEVIRQIQQALPQEVMA